MIDLLKKSSFFLIIGVFVIFIFIFTKEEEANNSSNLTTTVLSTDSIQEEPHTETIHDTALEKLYIDVKGAVVKPGVYEMEAGDRVNDVILIAGGFTEDADQSSVNLAQKVHDEIIIVVPHVPQNDAATDSSSSQSPPVDSSSNMGAGKVRINYATEEEIVTLPGIGPSKAQAIIQYREENGYFQTVEDLLQISGIGEKTLENMKENIQIP